MTGSAGGYNQTMTEERFIAQGFDVDDDEWFMLKDIYEAAVEEMAEKGFWPCQEFR